jgi:hypothetical protein
MLTVRPTAFMNINAFYAHAWGQGVINQAFAGREETMASWRSY